MENFMKEKMKEMMGSGMPNFSDGCNCSSFMDFCNTKADDKSAAGEKVQEEKNKQK